MRSLAASTIEACRSLDTADDILPLPSVERNSRFIMHVHCSYAAESLNSLHQSTARYRHKTLAWIQKYAFLTGTQARRKAFTERHRGKIGDLHVS